eukprot:1361244-Pyramimonas_sp.AAC.1
MRCDSDVPALPRRPDACMCCCRAARCWRGRSETRCRFCADAARYDARADSVRFFGSMLDLVAESDPISPDPLGQCKNLSLIHISEPTRPEPISSA